MNECLPTEAGEKSLPPFVITLLFSLGFDGFDVIPANAGIQVPRRMTTLRLFVSLSFARLKEEKKTPKQNPWIPACAGMTAVVNSDQGGRFCESLISSSTSNRSLFGIVEKPPQGKNACGAFAALARNTSLVPNRSATRDNAPPSSLIPSRRARAPYRGRAGAHRKGAPFDMPPSAATQGEVDTVAMQDEGNAPAPETGLFNNPSSVAIDLAYPADMLRRACTNTTVRTMMA